jgi:hypothetical protein
MTRDKPGIRKHPCARLLCDCEDYTPEPWRGNAAYIPEEIDNKWPSEAPGAFAKSSTH